MIMKFKNILNILVCILLMNEAYSQSKKIEQNQLAVFNQTKTSYITCADDVPHQVIKVLNKEFETSGFTLNECKSYKTTERLLKKTPEFIIIQGWKTEDKKKGIFVCEAPRYSHFFVFFFDMTAEQLYFTPTSNTNFLEFDLKKVLNEINLTSFHLLMI